MNCPRCARPLVRSHDELVCLTHGTMRSPWRAGDAIEPLGSRCAYCGDVVRQQLKHINAAAKAGRRLYCSHACMCAGRAPARRGTRP